MGFSWRDLCGKDPKPMTVREAEALQYLCALLPDEPVIVQVGAERGASTLTILDQCPDAFIFSMDIQPHPEEGEHLRRAGQEWERVVRGLGRSQDIGRHWPAQWQADLVYIDGDHRLAGVSADLIVWPAVVKENGILALHDYIPPEKRGPHIHGQVWEAVEQWRGSALAPEFEEILCVDRLLAFLRNSA